MFLFLEPLTDDDVGSLSLEPCHFLSDRGHFRADLGVLAIQKHLPAAQLRQEDDTPRQAIGVRRGVTGMEQAEPTLMELCTGPLILRDEFLSVDAYIIAVHDVKYQIL